MSAAKYLGIFSRQMEAIVYTFPNFQNCPLCEKDLKDNKHSSLHLGRKYAWIFVLGHCLFLLVYCSLLGTDHVRGQISWHIFAPNGGYCLYIHESEVNNNFGSIITQVIIELPKQRSVEFYHNCC